MTTRALIEAEIDRLDEQDLDELYELIRDFSKSKLRDGEGILERLSRIQIDGPTDFATNLDLYLSGKRCVRPDHDWYRLCRSACQPE